MTKNEALKAAIDGKKIFHPEILRPIHFDGNGFVCSEGHDMFMTTFSDDDDWGIYIETVDFFAAWQAYEEGKTIQWGPMRFSKKNEKSASSWAFPRDSIRGKWIILEDEND